MTQAVVCHECGTPVDATALFCPRCGVDVTRAQALAATAPMPASGDAEQPRVHATLRQNLRDATLGEYEILAELGRGGMATVFLAHEIALDRKVAIKVMAPHLFAGEGMVERFKLEARTAAQLSHPHIIPIYAVRETESTILFVMKFIEGRGLETIIKKLGPLPIPMVKDILTRVGGALGYAHRREVVHRDVKPSNVMIDEEGTPIVTDFGIAKVAEAQGLTVTGATIGTPSYMSPEQCEGLAVTGASDQYSLGIVAFEMLTGKLPFVGESAVSTMYKHCHEDLPPLEDFRPDCPGEVVETVTRMLAKAPEDRWPSLEAAVQKLGTQSPGYFDPVRTQLIELAKEGGYGELLAQIQTPKSPVPHLRGQTAREAPAPAPAPRRTRAWTAAAAVVLVAGGAATLAVLQPWSALGDPTPGQAGEAEAATPPTPGEGDPPAVIQPEDAGPSTTTPGAENLGATEPQPPTTPDGDDPPAEVPVATSPTQAAVTRTPPPAGPAPVASVRIGSAAEEIRVGEELVLVATPFDASSEALSGRLMAWRSDDESVARVSSSGRVQGLAPGVATVTVSVEGVSARHILSVAPVAVGSVEVAPERVSLQAGATQALTARPLAADGSALTGRTVTWASADAAVAVVSQGGEVRAVGAGTTTVTATAEGGTGSVTVTVEVDTRTALGALLQAYARALESGSIERVREVYPGLSSQQGEQLREALSGMRDLRATLGIESLDDQGDRATGRVTGTYIFVNAANGREVRQPIEFTATFERRGTRWVIVQTG